MIVALPGGTPYKWTVCFSCPPTKLPRYKPASPKSQPDLWRGEAGKHEPAVTPVRGHWQAWYIPGTYRFQGQGGEGRSPVQSQATSFTKSLTFWVVLDAGYTRDSWFRAKMCQSQPANYDDIQFPGKAAELQHFLSKWGRENKQAPWPFLQRSWESCSGYAVGNIGRLYKCQNPERRDQEKKKKESQRSYLQLSVQSCTTRPARHKTCIKNILTTADQNYHFICLQQHRW